MWIVSARPTLLVGIPVKKRNDGPAIGVRRGQVMHGCRHVCERAQTLLEGSQNRVNVGEGAIP